MITDAEISTPFPLDPDATWVYWSPFDTVEQGIPDEWVWERLRNRRDQMLSQSDFRMVTDAPWDQAPWEAYRQALRDLPEATRDPRQAVWPDPPTD
jgi:hypothetical protein